MTGFARAPGAVHGLRWAWEIKSVNARALDVRVRVPPGFDQVEAAARAAIPARIGRGTCYANLSVDRDGAAPVVRINQEALDAVVAALHALRDRVEAAPPTLDGLLSIRGVMDVVDQEPDEAEQAARVAAILESLGAALDGLVEVRRGEGDVLGGVLGRQLDRMAVLRDAAEANPARTPQAVRARLAEQLRVLLEGAPALDPDRLHQEAVLIAARADVREELDRLAAHIAAARELLAGGGAVGRRLDFLSQELGREANTLCAKSNDAAMTRIGLDLKTVVEQFREQVQNLE